MLTEENDTIISIYVKKLIHKKPTLVHDKNHQHTGI